MMKAIILLVTFFITTYAVTLQEKVEYLNNVKELIILTQTMRGDTNVYTKGEKLNVTIIDKDRKEVSASLKKLQSKFKMVDASVDAEFAKIHKYMKALNGVAADLDSLVTFKANSLLIQEMLRIGIEVQGSFFVKDSKLHQDASAMMMKKVLPMTEHLGQLRGLSAGAVACRNCNDDDALEYIKDYLALTADDLDDFTVKMTALQHAYPKKYPKDLKLETYAKDVKHFLAHIEKVVLKEGEMQTQEYDLFVQGTKVINKTLEYYKINEATLK
jgi:hypothetical protein